jgi:hypothetical protein
LPCVAQGVEVSGVRSSAFAVGVVSLGLVAVAGLTGCDEGPKVSTAAPVAQRFDVSRVVGRYTGRWESPETNASGNVTLTVAADARRRTMTMRARIGGRYLGLPVTAPLLVKGRYDARQAVLTGKNAVIGTYRLVIAPTGDVTGWGRGAFNGLVPSVKFPGAFTDGELKLDVRLNLAGGAQGTLLVRAARA